MLKNVKKKINEDYVNSEISKFDDGDLDLVMDNSKEINKKISKAPSLKKFAELGKLMFGMLQDFRKGDYTKVPWFSIASVGMALLYILNPMDVLPDFIPGLGYVDDFLILTMILRFVETDLHDYLDWKIDKKKRGIL
ncbi:YkvA family protein [Salinimicrobium sp. GXAS 041]|uniref:YkvA family protein n=1 Tax=Salinimicrobium sp. GXAS 041 TaxID=3400806 RepID=UPI003C787BEA